MFTVHYFELKDIKKTSKIISLSEKHLYWENQKCETVILFFNAQKRFLYVSS